VTQPLLTAVFHVHTAWSRDGSMTPHALIERAIDHGIDILAITDHNEIAGAHAVRERAPFQVIVGEEVRTAEGGDLIGLFLHERIPARTPIREAITQIKAQGGLVYLPHPFDTVRGTKLPDDLLEAIAPDIDIVETFNARNLHEEANAAAQQYATRHQKVACAGADVHIPPELGRTVVRLPACSAPSELLSSLRHAEFVRVKNPLWIYAAARWYRLLRRP
jgi:predicted metal-dependent phosphoesterase TrpH